MIATDKRKITLPAAGLPLTLRFREGAVPRSGANIQVTENTAVPAGTDLTPDVVHAPLLQYFPEVAAECGGDAASLLIEAHIDPAVLESGQPRATYRQIAELLECAARRLDRPDFGMMLASRQCREGIGGPLGHVMRHARSFGEVLEMAVRHSYAHSLASATWLRKAETGPFVLLGHDILLEGLPSTSQVMEQILLIGHLTSMRLTGGWARARRIHFRHGPVSRPSVYRRYFGCAPRFDQSFNATVYHAHDLILPVLTADADALPKGLSAIEARFQARERSMGRVVRGVILHVLDGDRCRSDWVAAQLGMHPRTLHRRLQQEGTSFRKVRDEVRRDLALYYLNRTDLDLTAISERLGFSEQSVLTRRCHKWFNRPPSRLRDPSRAANLVG